MKRETYQALLKDLQKLQKAIVVEHIARARKDSRLLRDLERRHAEAEVGGRLDDYVSLAAHKSAVQFLLRTVYVRVLEDLGILDPVRIKGDWGFNAFRDVAPALGKRSYFAFIFRDLAVDFPALFTPGPDELPLPSEDACVDLWKLWHHPNKANEEYIWNGEGFESRFLGDLYQDLDKDIRKRYALLQTPTFVEEYILKHTLEPALVEFDPAALRERGETFRLIDPTCGSGHFLIGGFNRLFRYWNEKGLASWEACERALESVWGCDINPHAVDIARFRLLLEVVTHTGVRDLARLAGLKLNLAVMDSLIPWERGMKQGELFPAMDRLAAYATAEERRRNAEFLGRAFHVVVGNPPYIVPKDVRKREDYRAFWPDSAAGKYALSAPFAERLFVLGDASAFVGQITANSFMKREFGKRLIKTTFPRWDLTAVVDTSGAFIPGHGTPTVIIIGRARRRRGEFVWAVLGKRGEPKRPLVPERGEVWSAIAALSVGEATDASSFITAAIMPHAHFEDHPWSLGGGPAVDVTRSIESYAPTTLKARAEDFGYSFQTNCDPVFLVDAHVPRMFRIPPERLRAVAVGDSIRDYWHLPFDLVLYPYNGLDSLDGIAGEAYAPYLWRFREILFGRATFSGGTYRSDGRKWWEWHQFSRSKHDVKMSINFAFVATHGHFVLDRGGAVFNRSAPVVKLSVAATIQDHFDLQGLLNSSVLGFWMRQSFQSKAGSGMGRGIQPEEWMDRLEYDISKLQTAPVASQDRTVRIDIVQHLDRIAQDRAACLPFAILAATDWTHASLLALLGDARTRYRALTHLMVALQEELDWLTYGSYGLIDPIPTVEPDETEPLAPGHRPFEIVFAREDDEADEDEKSAWWSRHGHDRVIEIPAHYSDAHRERLQARIDLIESDPRIKLLESPAYKRRWQTPDFDKETKLAAERWLLDRLEDLFAPGGPLAAPQPYRLEEIVSAWTRDPRVAAVADVFVGGTNVDVTLVAERLLRAEALPDNPRRIYTDEGLRRFDEWKRVWALQDQEDQGMPLTDPATGAPLKEIPLPSKWEKTDFVRPEYFQIRGKLNVPRERFILFADLQPVCYGWNGWRDQERGLAQVKAFERAETDPVHPLLRPTAEDPRRCGVTLGLWESLDDVRRWVGANQHGELQSLAEEACKSHSCPCPVLEKWQAWQRGELRIGAASASTESAEAAVTIEERAHLARQLSLYGGAGATLKELLRNWMGSEERLRIVMDDLVASGDVAVSGRGVRRKFAVVERGTRKASE